MSREMILLTKEKYDRLIQEQNNAGEMTNSGKMTDVAIQTGGGTSSHDEKVEEQPSGWAKMMDDVNQDSNHNESEHYNTQTESFSDIKVVDNTNAISRSVAPSIRMTPNDFFKLTTTQRINKRRRKWLTFRLDLELIF